VKRSQWPEQYRLTYKLPRDFTWSYKYTQSTTDEQAIDNFREIFVHLRDRLGKSSDAKKAPILKKVEKYDRHDKLWHPIPFTAFK
jgi:hypothetical protein